MPYTKNHGNMLRLNTTNLSIILFCAKCTINTDALYFSEFTKCFVYLLKECQIDHTLRNVFANLFPNIFTKASLI